MDDITFDDARFGDVRFGDTRFDDAIVSLEWGKAGKTMFFIMGISQGQKKLNFDQLIVCRNCGRYGHLEVYLVYSYLSLFFIPVFKWGKQYYVKTSCCDQTIPIDGELGRRIERGEVTSLPEDIVPESGQWGTFTGRKRCGSCGYETDEDFQYCPKCGARF